jgi:hypothetical protein
MSGKKTTLIEGNAGRYPVPDREWTGKIFSGW